jgi:protein-arginine kinase activator protein McsA
MMIAAVILLVVLILLVIANVIVKKDDKKYDPKKYESTRIIIRNVEEVENQRAVADHLSRWTSLVMKEKKTVQPDKTLQQQLEEAVEIEDYETAAKVRDLINKIKK